MNTKRSIIISILSLFLFAGIARSAETGDCQPIYGGAGACEQSGAIKINKQVKNPESNAFVENLTINNPQYQPGETIIFKITITNTSGDTLEKIEVFDFFPQYIDFVKGDGRYDQAKKTLVISVDQIKSKETKTYMVETKAVAKEKLPDEPQSRCIINQVSVKTNNNTSQDNTLVCIAKEGTVSTFETKGDTVPTVAPKQATAQNKAPASKTTATPVPTKKPTQPSTTKGGLPIHEPKQTQKTPDTGPEALALPSLISLMGIGIFMRSKAKT